MEQGLTPQRVVAELTKSPHGDLKAYVPIAAMALVEMPEFFHRLIAWNQANGQIRDSKIALPVIALGVTETWKAAHPEYPVYMDNALAHLALQSPRELVKALRFAKEGKVGGRRLRAMIERYLRVREADPGRFIRTVLTHRASMKALYSILHVRPNVWADSILFKGARPEGPLATVAQLRHMQPRDAAIAIMKHRIPFLVAVSALGGKAKDVDLVLALIEGMSPAELVTNAKSLEGMGVKTVPELRAAFAEGLKKVADSKTVTLKTTRAAQAIGDETMKAQMSAVQTKQIQRQSNVEGNWLVLGDKSGSMQSAIEATRVIAATLTGYVKGSVRLVFFNEMPHHIDVTGKNYDAILKLTKSIVAGGGTSIGCGVQYAFENKLDVQGIALVSDGGENHHPMFAQAYQRLCAQLGVDIPVYHYLLPGERNVFGSNAKAAGIHVQEFDLRSGQIDFYSLPNLVQTMRVGRYALFDEILNAPLLTMDEVFNDVEVENAEHAVA